MSNELCNAFSVADQGSVGFERSQCFPIRLIVATFNIWGDYMLSDRSANLRSELKFMSVNIWMFMSCIMYVRTTLTTMSPDILLLQEATTSNTSVVTSSLPRHICLSDVTSTYDITSGGNILWDRELLELVDHGFASIDCTEYPQRGLHWARLKIRHANIHVLACTAHLPWCGANMEIQTGTNSRIGATKRLFHYI